MDEALSLFHYHYQDTQAQKTLFLLHGTGGDEHDVLPLVQSLRAEYNLVGVRGNVSEQGMARFFARQSPGVFDQESIATETDKLAEFIQAWMKKYSLTADRLAFLGYSNGANMILATLFNHPNLIKKAALLHPMLPFQPSERMALKDSSFLVTYGENDLMISPQESQKVSAVLKKSGASVEVVTHPGGHELVKAEVLRLQEFLLH
ncbi:MAG TPA: alpha/beta hydrolase [Patescibacteria group bacterium]